MHAHHRVPLTVPAADSAPSERPGVLPVLLLIGCAVLFLGGVEVIRSADAPDTPRGCLAPLVVADGAPFRPACEASGNVATPVTPCSAAQTGHACAPFRQPASASLTPAAFSTALAGLR